MDVDFSLTHNVFLSISVSLESLVLALRNFELNKDFVEFSWKSHNNLENFLQFHDSF